MSKPVKIALIPVMESVRKSLVQQKKYWMRFSKNITQKWFISLF